MEKDGSLALANHLSGAAALSKALLSFEDAFELDSNSAEIATNLGYVNFRLGNLKEAERVYREALDLDPERFVTYLNLAELLVSEHETIPRLHEAESILTRARGLNENSAKVSLLQARCASLLGKFSEAKRFYDEYINMRRPTGKVLLEIGDFYLSFGKGDEAKAWYQKVEGDDKFVLEARERIQKMELFLLAKRYKWSHGRETIPVEVEIEIADEIDNITGLERVVFHVRDRSKKPLVEEDLRGKNVEQGLGMVMDLVSQYDGTMDVVQESEKWSKSVVVKLLRASSATHQEVR